MLQKYNIDLLENYNWILLLKGEYVWKNIRVLAVAIKHGRYP